MATVHFICGPLGAGKTTYATALAQRAKAVRLSVHEWMGELFGPDRPPTAAPEWEMERSARCEGPMWTVADQFVARGVDVVFDIALARRDDRDRFRARASQTAALIKMHYLDVPRDVRRARVLARQREAGATSSAMTEAAFDAFDAVFEAPTDDELYGAMIVCDG
jgi:predicted kinase